MRHDVIAMEDYVATDQRPLAKCLADVAACDVYVGIFAGRYGYIPPKDNPEKLSITEREFREAVKTSKHCLMFLLHPKASWPYQYIGRCQLVSRYTVCQSCSMHTPSAPIKPKNHRFPMEIISHAVWLYFRFCSSFCDVEELLCERGVTVTYEAIRKWCHTFGQHYTNQLIRRRPRPGDQWHLDEVFLAIKGEHHYTICGGRGGGSRRQHPGYLGATAT